MAAGLTLSALCCRCCQRADSWGSTSPVYDFQASKLDSWLYNNQDCISHFAAGNYGENDNLDSTITSPATAKNAVTVGATKSAVANYVSQTIAPVFSLSVEIKRKDKPVQYVGVRLVKAGGCGSPNDLSLPGSIAPNPTRPGTHNSQQPGRPACLSSGAITAWTAEVPQQACSFPCPGCRFRR